MKNYFEKTVTITINFYVDFKEALEEVLDEMDWNNADERYCNISGYFADWWLPEIYCSENGHDTYLYDSGLYKEIENAFDEWLNSKEALERIEKWRKERG